MHHLRTSFLAVGLALAASAPTSAQQGHRGSGGFIGGFNLVEMPAVQDELKMDDSQRAASKKVAERMKARFGQDMNKLKGLNADEQAQRRVTLADAHYEEGMKQLHGILQPDQVERLDQILLQQRGPTAMLEPKIVQALQLRNEQAQQVAAIMAEATNQQNLVVQAAGGKRTKEAAARVEEIAASAHLKAVDVLSPEQKRTWTRIAGEPFRPNFAGDPNARPEATAPPR